MKPITTAGVIVCTIGAALNLITGIRTNDPWRYASAIALAGLAVMQWKLIKTHKDA
mgnify:CR=1 FL=1